MRRYIEHVKSKEPHERRKHAMQLSGVLVGLFFVAWVATFASRLGMPVDGGSTNPPAGSGQTAAAANATMLNQDQSSTSGAAQLEVSTSSVYSY